MSKGAAALVYGDYEAVMPLAYNRKAGISYLYQPAFTQQLGIFSKQQPNEELINAFIAAIKSRFRFAEIFVNFETALERPNLVLSLRQAYSEISKGFTNGLKSTLKKAAKAQLRYVSSNDAESAVQLSRKLYAHRMPHVKSTDYKNLIAVCKHAEISGNLLIRCVTDAENKLLSSVLLFQDDKRLYNILASVTTEGRAAQATHFLFNELIREFAAHALTLDFEGSSIESIANFYKRFGAENEPFYFLRYNNLPRMLRILKK